VRLYCALTLDEHDHLVADVVEDPEPPAHGVVRLREFSIQGDAASLRRLAATAMDAADLADVGVG
jgi:hypothetical protein